MIFIYNIILLVLVLTLWWLILIGFVMQPKLRAGFWQKLGFYKLGSKEKTILVHAVSVGEVNAVFDFVKELRKKHPDAKIVLSTVTRTGQEIANKKLSDYVNKIIYFPYDFLFSVFSLLVRLKPNLVVIAETEIWPNFSFISRIMNIPVMIINGRISPSSYKGYKNLSFFFAEVLNNYTSILMQTKEDASRIIEVGAHPAIVEVMGNLKLDINPPIEEAQIESLKEQFKTQDNKILIAGSTHKGEDELVLKAFKEIKKEVPELKLIIAPRHPERNDSVFELIQKDFKCGKRSSADNFKDYDVILLDTLGELGKIYSICDVAFIGGSFSKTGGHNPLEASIFGKPVISGDEVFNFKEIYSSLVQNKAVILCSEKSFTKELKSLFLDEEKYNNLAKNSTLIFDENKGAIKFALDEVDKFF